MNVEELIASLSDEEKHAGKVNYAMQAFLNSKIY